MPVPQMQREGHRRYFGPYAFDPTTEELWKHGFRLKLQGQPLTVLAILLEKPGQIVTRDEIRQRLWSADTFVDFEHSLNTDIKRLREALCDDAETPRYIETLRGKGYRFIGEALTSSDVPEKPSPSLKIAIPVELATLKRVKFYRRLKRTLITLVTFALLLGSADTVLKPRPLKIAASRRLTRTPYKKSHRVMVSIVTDGPRLYFREYRSSRWGISQVSTSGGEVSSFPVDYTEFPDAQDISPDLSQLLIADWYGLPCCRIWLAPLPSGPPRLIPTLLSPWNRFTRDGKGIVYTNEKKELLEADLQGVGSRRILSAPNITCPQQSPAGRLFRFTNLPDLQSLPTIWEAEADSKVLRPLFADRQPTVCGVWSPDGKIYAFHRWDGLRWNLWAVRESDAWLGRFRSQPVQLTFGPLSYIPSTFSRDSKSLYSLGVDARGELAAYAPNSSQSRLYLPGTSATNVAFSRDGKWIAYVSYPDGTLWRSRIDGGARRQLSFPPMLAMTPRWSPDGRFIVFTEVPNMGGMFNGGGDIYLVSAESGAPLLLATGMVNDPTWSPDGRSIAYAACNECPASPGVKIMDLRTRTVQTLPESERFYSPRWSPDGTHLVAVDVDGRGVWLYTFADRQWVNLISSNFPTGFPEWSDDGKYVYVNVMDERIVRVNISSRHSQVQLLIKDIARTGWWGGWFGLTPDGKILLLRNTGSEDLYAFDFQNP